MHDNKSMSADKVINIITSAKEVLFSPMSVCWLVGDTKPLHGFSRDTEWRIRNIPNKCLLSIQIKGKAPQFVFLCVFFFSLSLTL